MMKQRTLKILAFLVLIMFVRDLKGEVCPDIRGGCCSGFYRDTSSGQCTACIAGYYGINCSLKCDNGYYGIRCLYMCNCKENEICNHEVGCISFTTVGNIQTSEHSVLQTNDESKTVLPKASTHGTNEHGYTHGKKLQDDTWVPLILYITITSVSIIVIIGLFSVWKYSSIWWSMCKKEDSECLGSDTNNKLPRPVSQISEEPIDGIIRYNHHLPEDVYHEIRESQMIRTVNRDRRSRIAERRVSKSVDNLRLESIYNHLNHSNSTPNIREDVADLYDHSYNIDELHEDTYQRNAFDNHLYDVTSDDEMTNYMAY